MLSSLTIQNVVLIEHLTINFHAGLCALTGETGAGKSILLDSLGLAIGARSESRLVRKGAEKASVTAVFEVDAPTFLKDADVLVDAGEPLILKRVVHADGRSRASINDQPVSIGLLKRVGESLVEIHGQFDTRGLLDPSTHRQMLDDYMGIDDALPRAYATWREQECALQALKNAVEKSREDEVYLRESLEDLDALTPHAGEEKTLSELRDRLRHREQALKVLSSAYYELSSDKDPVSKALGMLDKMAETLPESASTVIDTLDRAMSEMQEARALIGALRDDLYHEDHNLEDVDDRLHALRAQARKHECRVDDLAEKRDEIARRLNDIEHEDERLARQIKERERAKADYIRHAERVSVKRSQTASTLDQLVMKELPPLKLEKAKFHTCVKQLEEPDWGPHGWDQIRFLVATNPGADPGPLGKIASGGEMARFMLALKVVMSRVGQACTMVFDEVDAGVGGAVADAVGERLARVALDGKQVMVVTHAPQVAARARSHYIVRKDGQDIMHTNVVQLSEMTERREEIARMLAGATITEEARAAADKLMETGT